MAFIPSSKCLVASLKTLSRTPETYVSAPHLWSITSSPPLEAPGSPGCMGAEVPGKPSALTVGQGFSRLVPISGSLGIKNPCPLGPLIPSEDLPPLALGMAPASEFSVLEVLPLLLSLGPLIPSEDLPPLALSMAPASEFSVLEVLPLLLWLVALVVLWSRSSPRDLCILLLLPPSFPCSLSP